VALQRFGRGRGLQVGGIDHAAVVRLGAVVGVAAGAPPAVAAVEEGADLVE
jgi:hypothetical protein